MKNKMSGQQSTFVMTLLFSAFVLGGISQLQADDNHGDRNGFRDHGGQYHRYGYHNHHRGYWNQRSSGVRVWVNV